MRDKVPDWQFTVRLWGDTGLTDEGWSLLSDAVEGAGIHDLIMEAIGAALDGLLPRPPRDRDVPDWYSLRVDEAPASAMLCPAPAHHVTPPAPSPGARD